MDWNEEFYFYFDQGGLFGSAKVAALKEKAPECEDERHVLAYYFGKLSLWNFQSVLYLFKQVFPKCPVHLVDGSDVPETAFQSMLEYKPGIG